MSWTPIKRASIKTRGVHPRFRKLLQVEIHLSRYPPREWQHFFQHPTGVSISLSMHPPTISGDVVTITPADNEIERYVRHVDERIESANRQYQQRVLPKQQRQRRQEELTKQDEKRRLEEAQARINALNENKSV